MPPSPPPPPSEDSDPEPDDAEDIGGPGGESAALSVRGLPGIEPSTLGISHPAWVAARDASAAAMRAILTALDEVEALHPEGTFTDVLPGHVGSPHLPLDVRAHWVVESALYSALGEIAVVGEEVKRSLSIPPDGLLALVDPPGMPRTCC